MRSRRRRVIKAWVQLGEDFIHPPGGGSLTTAVECRAAPRLIVKFGDLPDDLLEVLFTQPIDNGNVGDLIDEDRRVNDLLPWDFLKGQYPDFQFATLYPSVSVAGIRETFELAKQNAAEFGRTFDVPHPLRFFRLDFAPERKREELEQLCEELPAHGGEIDRVYVESPPSTPGLVGFSNDPKAHLLDYIDRHQVRFAWNRPGGDGSGIKVVDLEQGWEFHHQDLPLQPSSMWLISGVNATDVADREHGTAALGIVSARDNNVGTVGIAPRATLRALSAWREVAGAPPTYNVADAIWSLVNVMNPIPLVNAGDVLLIEAQSEFVSGGNIYTLPVEMLEHNAVAILTATMRGLVVVEAAGNGGHDLDALPGQFPGKLSAIQTYAILVAAGQPSGGGIWEPWDGTKGASNVGSRIDCFARGDEIYVLQPYPADSYGRVEGGTSGAAAVVAGIVASLQGIANAGTPSRRYFSWEMRDWLRDPGNPLPDPSGANPDPKIGRLPDMRHIINTFHP